MDNLRKMVFVAGRELVLPVTPESFEVGRGVRIETLNIHGLGDIRVAGYPSLDNINISSFFPANEYPFAVAPLVDPWDMVAQFSTWADQQTVVRFIVTGTTINIPVLIEDIRYGEQDGSNDVYYTLTLAEYRYVSLATTITPTQTQSRPITTPPPVPKTYTVVAGDTLRAIARKFYGDSSKYTEIASANGIKNPNVIKVGAVLTL